MLDSLIFRTYLDQVGKNVLNSLCIAASALDWSVASCKWTKSLMAAASNFNQGYEAPTGGEYI
jgi:hypothetical protein